MWQNHLGWWKKIPGDLPTIHTALPPISLKWSSFNFGLWRHFCCSRKKFLGLLGGSPALHPIFCSHSPWPVPQSSLLAWLSWRYLTLCLHALPWAGPAACNISCQSLMVMWEIPSISLGSTQIPLSLQKFLSSLQLHVIPLVWAPRELSWNPY